MGKKTSFGESLAMNTGTWYQYFNRLCELAISMFEWKNVPDTINVRYIELGLFEMGSMVYFNDEVVGDLCLNCLVDGEFNVYGDPVRRRAYSRYNNYDKSLDESNSVIIWNNYLHTNNLLDVQMFAKRLYNLDRIIDVNANAQKTPVLIQGDEKTKVNVTKSL